MTLKNDEKSEENLTLNFESFENWHKEFDEVWLQNSKVSKIYTLMGCFWPNYIMFELKKYRGVMFNCTQDWYKFWRKTGLCFQKLTWGIWQIFTRALESLQIETLMAYFCLKLKMYEFKNCRGVICHGNDKWCKIWRGTDLSVQNWYEEFDEFLPEHSKISKICTLMGCFWTKYITFELKKVLRSYVWWQWLLMQNLKEKWLVLSKMTLGI